MKNYINSISLFKETNFSKNVWWKLKVNIYGYQNSTGKNLVTQIFKNRIFKLIYPTSYQNLKKLTRILVQFFEDGYICWIDFDKLIIEKYELKKRNNVLNERSFIQKKIPLILEWIENQSKLKNEYLWGGTLGPDFDCSGLIQTAFFLHQIYIPRDSYQMKSFCKHLFYFQESYSSLKPGDLLFFGNKEKSDHVGIYKSNGFYYHSSGKEFGRNGIGLDTLKETNDKISLHYKSKLISAGRITREYRWDKTLR